MTTPEQTYDMSADILDLMDRLTKRTADIRINLEVNRLKMEALRERMLDETNQ